MIRSRAKVAEPAILIDYPIRELVAPPVLAGKSRAEAENSIRRSDLIAGKLLPKLVVRNSHMATFCGHAIESKVGPYAVNPDRPGRL